MSRSCVISSRLVTSNQSPTPDASRRARRCANMHRRSRLLPHIRPTSPLGFCYADRADRRGVRRRPSRALPGWCRRRSAAGAAGRPPEVPTAGVVDEQSQLRTLLLGARRLRQLAFRFCGCSTAGRTSRSRATDRVRLQQRREIRGGSVVTRPAGGAAALHGRASSEGLEKAERNLLPILNNLLENREMASDGAFLSPGAGLVADGMSERARAPPPPPRLARLMVWHWGCSRASRARRSTRRCARASRRAPSTAPAACGRGQLGARAARRRRPRRRGRPRRPRLPAPSAGACAGRRRALPCAAARLLSLGRLQALFPAAPLTGCCHARCRTPPLGRSAPSTTLVCSRRFRKRRRRRSGIFAAHVSGGWRTGRRRRRGADTRRS